MWPGGRYDTTAWYRWVLLAIGAITVFKANADSQKDTDGCKGVEFKVRL